MHSQFWIFGRLFVALILMALAPSRADYIMDDRNSTIHYVGQWYQYVSALNTSQLFDGTA